MLCLRSFNVMKSPSGKKQLAKQKNIKKWSNMEVEDFDHDIFSPDAWRKYLANDYRDDNGRVLPRQTRDGDPLVYQVYFWGAPNWMLESFNGKRWICLFPGHDKDGSTIDIMSHGRI